MTRNDAIVCEARADRHGGCSQVPVPGHGVACTTSAALAASLVRARLALC